MVSTASIAQLMENWEDEVDEGLVSIVTCAISHDVMRYRHYHFHPKTYSALL